MEFPPLKRGVPRRQKISDIAEKFMEKHEHVVDVCKKFGSENLRFFLKQCDCGNLVFFPTRIGCFEKLTFIQCPLCNPSVWISFCEENTTCKSAKSTCKFRDGYHPEDTKLIIFSDKENKSVFVSGCFTTCI